MARFPSSPDPVALTKHTKDEWSRLDGFYSVWVDRWRRVMDFLRSQHWNVLKEVHTDQVAPWKEFPVVNLTLGIYSEYLSQWLESEVRFSAIPASPDPNDISSAEMGEWILRYLWDMLDIESKRIDLGAWLLATGNAGVRAYWDTNTGNMLPLAIPDPRDPEMLIPINPETMEPDPGMGQPIMVDAGEIGLDVLSPQFTRWGLKRSDGVMVGMLLTPDEVSDRYGEQAVNDVSFNSHYAGLSMDLANINHPGIVPMKEDRALVVEHYLPRSSRFPGGLWWTSSGTALLTPANPLPAGEVPIVNFRWIPLPGHPTFGLSPLHDITFSNKAYEKALKRQLEWIKRVLPKVLLKSGGGIEQGAISDEPGQELYVAEGLEPDFLKPPEPPRGLDELRDTALTDALLVGGFRFGKDREQGAGDPTRRFRQPSEFVTGNETKLAQISSKSSWQRLGRVLLGYVGQFYTDERVVAVTGPDRTYQWITFKGTDFANLSATLKVDEIPLYPWNRQGLKDTVTAFLETQAAPIFFQDANGELDKDRIKAAAEAVGIDVAIDTLDPDVVEARNEHQSFRNNQPVPVQNWQNDEAHLEEHIRVLKSMSFKGWPQQAQEAFLEHVSDHQERLQQAQQQQQEALLSQERGMREIRAETEASQKVREKMGEALIEALFSILNEKDVGGGGSNNS